MVPLKHPGGCLDIGGMHRWRFISLWYVLDTILCCSIASVISRKLIEVEGLIMGMSHCKTLQLLMSWQKASQSEVRLPVQMPKMLSRNCLK